MGAGHLVADLVVSAMPGQPQFIQNINDDINGFNGTLDQNRKPVGWLYQNMTGQVDKPTQPNSVFPLLDVPKNSTAPILPGSLYNVASEVGTLESGDFPSTGNPANGNTGIAVDELVLFQLYLVWQFTNNNTAIYYPLAYTFWQAEFYATANNNNPPINNINIPQGVTSNGSNNYAPSNATPGQMFPSAATIADGNLKWVPA
jgi:hypothetical protein